MSLSPRSSATFSRGNNSLFRRIVVLGPKAVGKSALTIRFCEGIFHSSYLPTIEDTYLATLKLEGQIYNLEIIDTGGQDEYSILSSQCTIGVHGYLLVFDITDYLSFELLKVLHERLVNMLGLDTIPCILVGMKLDEQEDRAVNTAEVEQMAREWLCPYIECSAKDGIHIDTVFHSLILEMERPTVQVAASHTEKNTTSRCASM
ncbi:small GTP-binding protein of Ras family [Galdieria sulphuraria]|uniref:Small GTP-binding protein of Ras family n=1 Tax=Galdieria sulphuraria TaxID=130081 RepID=M2XFE0_GALSU|nr:small GTP-binding protein of Ras family [Galdieria sulphuraria]EME28722.1 small GTP-binding protein of Ras family [Galdieria sulphuraria]|eukprot:XP_005705242.1 small GTP-binding protein of Ras family [Galdieria sulphuraria]